MTTSFIISLPNTFRVIEEPEEYFCRFSKTLEAFLRSTLGGQWFHSDPEALVKDCFPAIFKLQKKLLQAKEALASYSESGDDPSVRKVAKKLGCKAAKDGTSYPCQNVKVSEFVEQSLLGTMSFGSISSISSNTYPSLSSASSVNLNPREYLPPMLFGWSR